MEQVKAVAAKLDEALDFGKIIGGLAGQAVEFFDGKILEGALSYGVSKVPEEYLETVEAVFNAYLDDDLASLSPVVVERLNDLIDIPELEEEDEGLLLGAITSAIFKVLSRKINA